MREILDVARELEIPACWVESYGRYKAKVDVAALEADRPGGRLVLVSAITPTPAGEGKTTVVIGLGQSLARIGERACVALREPSMGPCFGLKGGGTGGGQAQVVPGDMINLHFNGDFHAITAAHNLLAALVDNHLFFGNALGLDAREVTWRRVQDVNDRALRHLVAGLGGRSDGIPRETGFDITAASEVMAILCLAQSRDDLRERLGRCVVGYTADGSPVTAADLKAHGAMAALLNDAIHPNLVQTLAGSPAILHGGPFGNIAHGCNSLLATRMALHYADLVVTEAGFGSDLGMEKFLDIKCRGTGISPALVVIVATVRALKMHGGTALDRLGEEDVAALERGLPNLAKHLENVAAFGLPAVVAVNRFRGDTEEELALLTRYLEARSIPAAVCDPWQRGPEGAEELARLVAAEARRSTATLQPLYRDDQPIEAKIRAIATRMYGAEGVHFTPEAGERLARLRRHGWDHLPVCMAKTHMSLSDDPRKPGRPSGFTITVRDIEFAIGAGFVVPLTGKMLRMPGLSRVPRAEQVDVDSAGHITGLLD
jgi:formate--tetrahydrofolate ligase